MIIVVSCAVTSLKSSSPCLQNRSLFVQNVQNLLSNGSCRAEWGLYLREAGSTRQTIKRLLHRQVRTRPVQNRNQNRILNREPNRNLSRKRNRNQNHRPNHHPTRRRKNKEYREEVKSDSCFGIGSYHFPPTSNPAR